MILNFVQVLRLCTLMRTRGSALAKQGEALVRLLNEAPTDLSGLLGPVLLIAQGYAKGVGEALSYIMQAEIEGEGTREFHLLPLERQGTLLSLSVLWAQLRGTLGSLAFARRLPTLSALTVSTPEGRRFGANAVGVALATRLEALTNVSGTAGLSFETFWSLSSTARAALGRLAAMDLALTWTYDFNPITEVDALLREGIPRALDVTAMLRQINENRVPDYQESPAGRAWVSVVPDQTPIQALAQILTGDANRWRDLVTYNNLRAPYISSNPLDQLGDPQGALTLQGPSGVGSQTLVVDEITAVYPDQRLYFDTGALTFLRTVVAVDRALHQVTLDVPLDVFVDSTTVVWLFSPSYDVLGKVLQPGDSLLVPVLQLTRDSTHSPQLQGLPTAERIYGTDALVDAHGRLGVDDGDLLLATGLPNIAQALRHRLEVPRGSVIHHPRYGCGLHGLLGRLATPYIEFFATVEARQTLLRDPRIARVTNLTVTQEADQLLVDFTGVTKAEEQFPSTTIAVVVR